MFSDTNANNRKHCVLIINVAYLSSCGYSVNSLNQYSTHEHCAVSKISGKHFTHSNSKVHQKPILLQWQTNIWRAAAAAAASAAAVAVAVEHIQTMFGMEIIKISFIFLTLCAVFLLYCCCFSSSLLFMFDNNSWNQSKFSKGLRYNDYTKWRCHIIRYYNNIQIHTNVYTSMYTVYYNKQLTTVQHTKTKRQCRHI